MKNLKTTRGRLAAFVCTTVALTVAGCTTTPDNNLTTAEPGNVWLTRATQTLDSIYAHYSVEGTCLLRENCPPDAHVYNPDKRQYSYLWPYAGTFSAVCALLDASGSDNVEYTRLLEKRVLPGLQEYLDNRRQPAAYASYISSATPASNRFYDDNSWVGINFADAYRLTHNRIYLQQAEQLWKFVQSGQDNRLGGGIYWCEQAKDTKNTCSNAPAAVLALKLYRATADSAYLEQGKQLYRWTQTTLQDTVDCLYFDNIDCDGHISKNKYAYNSGQMMKAAAMLYQMTGQEAYLADAQRIAQSCHRYFFTQFTPEHEQPFRLIKKGDVWFTAVMLRGYIELYRADGNPTYLRSFRQSLDYAWQHARDADGLFNTDFSGEETEEQKWLLTQAAMVEMYARLSAL